MSAGDPEDNVEKLMAVNQEHSGGAQDLLDTEEEYIKEEEPSNSNPPTGATGDSKIQELSVEESDKLMKQLDVKCEGEISTNKDRVTRDHDEDYEEESETVETVCRKEVAATTLPFKVTKDESLEGNRKNPLLLSLVVRCLFKFLDVEDMKNGRLVCRDWGLIGKRALASRALIRFHKYEIPKEPKRLPVDFQSTFLDSAALFSAFKIDGFLYDESASNSWTIEELKKFFEVQEKYIKELAIYFKYPSENLLKKIALSSWISKSPMVQKDTKHLTKLKIGGEGRILDIRPLHLIAHIKDLSLSSCRIHVEAGIKISSIKLKLSHSTFHQDGTKLHGVRINDVVDLDKTKEVSLINWGSSDEYVLDLWGNGTLGKLNLDGGGIEIVNGETSQWAIEHLKWISIPYSLNSQMKIKELYLSHVGTLDLFTLPTSIQKLVLHSVHTMINLHCSQPIVLQNLQYLQIVETGGTGSNFSFLFHFTDCPQLTHLKLHQCSRVKLKSLWMPESVKTLTLEDTYVMWLDESSWNLETLVLVADGYTKAKKICQAKITVDDFIVQFSEISMDKRFAKLLEFRKRFNFCKRLCIGEFLWDDKQLEDTVMKEHVEVKSAFYVFEKGQKGRALSKQAFHELIPEYPNHLYAKHSIMEMD